MFVIFEKYCTILKQYQPSFVIFEWINWHFQKILYYFETILAGFCQNKLHDDLPCSNNNYGDTSSYLYICSLKAFSFFILKRIIAQLAIEIIVKDHFDLFLIFSELMSYFIVENPWARPLSHVIREWSWVSDGAWSTLI